MQRLLIFVVLAFSLENVLSQMPRSASDIMMDIYRSCLREFSTSCVQPKAMQWFNEVLPQNEIRLTDNLCIIRTSNNVKVQEQVRSNNEQEQLIANIENFLATHALRLKAPAYFKSAEGRALIPDFLLHNVLSQNAIIPLMDKSSNEGRGMVNKILLPFLLGLKLKTYVLVPLALGLIALKTWKAMTLGLLSLVLSGALIIFKITKPKIVNYEVVHYPPPHIEHIEHIPHHVEHIVPHHIEHVPHHVDHHIDLPHHAEHVEHIEHANPVWDPHPWARSSQEPKDAQEIAYAGQRP